MATAVFYAIGVARLWRRAGAGRGISAWSALSFAIGWVVLFVALVSPVWLSSVLFSVHMTQHMLLMLVGAPLITFGQPLLVLSGRSTIVVGYGLRMRYARDGHCACGAGSRPRYACSRFTPWCCGCGTFRRGTRWRCGGMRSMRRSTCRLCSSRHCSGGRWFRVGTGRRGDGAGVCYVFLTAIHSGALGALPAVSNRLCTRNMVGRRRCGRWTASPISSSPAVLMWVPAAVIFIVFGLALLAAWLGEAERRVRFGATDAAAPAASRHCDLTRRHQLPKIGRTRG